MARTVLVDTNALIFLLDPRTPRLLAARMRGLLEDIDRSQGKLIIPAQVAGEYLSGAADAGPALLARLRRSRRVEVASFDFVAAMECSLMERIARATGDKRAPVGRGVAWQKVKIDRQIVAIARVRGADLIVSDDEDIQKIASALGIAFSLPEQLDLPDWARQGHIEDLADYAAIPIRPRPVLVASRAKAKGSSAAPPIAAEPPLGPRTT